MNNSNLFAARRCAWALVTGLVCTGAAADVAVVVGAKSPLSTLSAEQVSSLFMGKARTFPDGSPALAVDQKESAPARVEFYTKVLGKDEAQMKAYWSRLVFTGKGSPPKELDGNAAVKQAVGADPKLIGYIEKSAVDASVKVLLSAP